ncbi:MAG: hypothetical protein AB7F96_21185 [Beijerinckiaceae bacterium]
MVVGFAPGGGDAQGGAGRGAGPLAMRPQPVYDLTARLYTRHFGRFLPGSPEVTIRHMPGAGSLRAAQWLASGAPRDGTVLASVSGQALRTMLLGNVRDRDAAANFAAIGGRIAGEYFCATAATGFRRPAAFGATAPYERSYLHARAFSVVSGMPVRLVAGYANLAQIALAFRRQEIDGFCGLSLQTLQSQLGDLIASGALKPLLRFSPAGTGSFRHIARAGEGAPPGLAEPLQLISEQGVLDWALLGPAGVPLARVAALRGAYVRMVRDPAFLRDAVSWGIAVDPVDPARIETALKTMASASAEAVRRIEEWSAPPRGK